MAFSSRTAFDYKLIQPITNPIKPEKQEKKRHWGSHPYFTRRAWNVVQQYIKTFSRPGDLVLDPYGGSGVTAIEALVLGRKAIHCDINPMANFICQQIAISPFNVGHYINDLKKNVTPHEAEIDTIDNLSSAFDEIVKKCKDFINEIYEMSDAEVDRLENTFWYPSGIKLPHNADVEYVEQLFTKRQILSLSLLLHHIEQISDYAVRNVMRFVFSATLNKTNLTFSSTHGRLASRGNSGIMHRYRYWIPPETLDLNVWKQFEGKFKNIVKVKLETNQEIGHSYEDLSIFDVSATELSRIIPEESIDYIYTDPPYGKHIAYLDLSTMWNAWLGFEVTEDIKQLEVIEGGDLGKTKQRYIQLLEASIDQMFKVLKYDRWMSIVFAHKDPAYWDAIIKSAQKSGFEYVNTVVQPSKTPSLHKRKNPLKVLSGELVLNFRKVRNPKSIAISKLGTSTVQLIKDIAELQIVKTSGASTENIYNALIPKLLENGLLSQVTQQLKDITPVLKQEFDYSESENLWYIRPNTRIGCFIPLNDRIRFYLLDCLKAAEREERLITFDEVIYQVMPNLINGQTPAEQTILNVLEKVAYSSDGQHWRLGSNNGQLEFDFDIDFSPGIVPELNFPKNENQIQHDLIIYALSKLAIATGLKVYIGKNERAKGGWNGELFRDLSIDKVPDSWRLDRWQKGKIQQIDLIWIDSQNDAFFAFEIEKSTAITSGIDRFIELLKVFPNIARSVVLVIPQARLQKMNGILRNSHYIGSPMYMENKLTYCYFESVSQIYSRLLSQSSFSLDTLVREVKTSLIYPTFGGYI